MTLIDKKHKPKDTQWKESKGFGRFLKKLQPINTFSATTTFVKGKKKKKKLQPHALTSISYNMPRASDSLSGTHTNTAALKYLYTDKN